MANNYAIPIINNLNQLRLQLNDYLAQIGAGVPQPSTSGTKGAIGPLWPGGPIFNSNTVSVAANSSITDTLQTPFPSAFNGATLGVRTGGSTALLASPQYQIVSLSTIRIYNNHTTAQDITYWAFGN